MSISEKPAKMGGESIKQYPYIPIKVEVTHHTADGKKVVKIETLDETTHYMWVYGEFRKEGYSLVGAKLMLRLRILKSSGERGAEAERVVKEYYQKKEYQVWKTSGKLSHRFQKLRSPLLDATGRPSLLARRYGEFTFIEARTANRGLSVKQVEWISKHSEHDIDVVFLKEGGEPRELALFNKPPSVRYLFEKVSIRRMKEAVMKLPENSTLRKLVLAEPDEIERWAALGQGLAWIQLSEIEEQEGKFRR